MAERTQQNKSKTASTKDQQASAKRDPEPDGKLGEGADRDAQVDQREKAIPDDGMLGNDASR